MAVIAPLSWALVTSGAFDSYTISFGQATKKSNLLPGNDDETDDGTFASSESIETSRLSSGDSKWDKEWLDSSKYAVAKEICS